VREQEIHQKTIKNETNIHPGIDKKNDTKSTIEKYMPK
jgi:hypothetical protein